MTNRAPRPGDGEQGLPGHLHMVVRCACGATLRECACTGQYASGKQERTLRDGCRACQEAHMLAPQEPR